MPAKSSAKLGKMMANRGEKVVGGARRWLAQGDGGRPDAVRTAAAPCWGTTRGSTWSDHGVRATSEVANSRESEAALGD